MDYFTFNFDSNLIFSKYIKTEIKMCMKIKQKTICSVSE